VELGHEMAREYMCGLSAGRVVRVHFKDFSGNYSTLFGLTAEANSNSLLGRLQEVIRVQMYARLIPTGVGANGAPDLITST
jgi:hypothetical protein